MASEGQQHEMTKAAERTGMNPAVLASAASVLLSWYFFFIRRDRLRGIFVGLWPPTLLAFASYFEQERMSNKLQERMGNKLMGRIERMVQPQ